MRGFVHRPRLEQGLKQKKKKKKLELQGPLRLETRFQYSGTNNNAQAKDAPKRDEGQKESEAAGRFTHQH